MGLDSGDFSPDAEAGLGQASEQVSEKAREQASSKTLAGIARTRKDESKGRKASDLLTSMLVALLRDARFDPLIEPVMGLLRLNLPAPYVVGLLSLVSLEASSSIRRAYDPSLKLLKSEPAPEAERVDFDPNRLRADFRDRINEWIADVFLVATKDPSYVLTDKFLSEISSPKLREAFVLASEAVLTFFFKTKNVDVPQSEARSLSAFLLKELETRISKIERTEGP